MIDDIIAQCTPQGNGAIALLRISGSRVRALFARMARLSSKKNIETVDSHTVHHGYICDSVGGIIDEVMIIFMDAPRTFTGESVIEITCHNNQFIIERIIAQAILCGARLAQRGEFAQRAWINGKIDLVQAEAINELIHAQTESATRAALAQVQGSFSRMLFDLEKRLIRCLALSEASFEFIDEEMSFGDQIFQEVVLILEHINHLKHTFDQQQHIREGIRIALIGSVNAGKSSLFNALLRRDRAIVTDIAGTTRDSLEAGIRFGGFQCTLVDTAGLRQTHDIIEQEGIRRSFEEAQKADIILLVIDHSRVMTEQEKCIYDELHALYTSRVIYVHTKSDLVCNSIGFVDQLSQVSLCVVSNYMREGFEKLEAAIVALCADRFAHGSVACVLNARHYTMIIALEKTLQVIQDMLTGSIAYELLSIHFNDALQALSELTGKTVSERAMDAIFREFCVGK
jgi:tRNA modification GTPase